FVHREPEIVVAAEPDHGVAIELVSRPATVCDRGQSAAKPGGIELREPRQKSSFEGHFAAVGGPGSRAQSNDASGRDRAMVRRQMPRGGSAESNEARDLDGVVEALRDCDESHV